VPFRHSAIPPFRRIGSPELPIYLIFTGAYNVFILVNKPPKY